MTEEEIQALQEAKEAAETRAAEAERVKAEAEAAAEKAKSDLTGVVSELTDERKKKAEALEELNKFKSPNPEPKDPQDVSSVVQAELERRERERIKADLESTIEEFKQSKTEFQTDTNGLVFDKFKRDLSRFNFADVTSKEQMKARLEEAYRFLNSGQTPTKDSPAYEGASPEPGTPPDGAHRMSADEAKTIEGAGLSEERFNKLAGKYGDAMVALGFGSQK